MKRLLWTGLLMLLLAVPVSAMEFTAPEAPEQVVDLIPESADSFGEGLWNVVIWALREADDSLDEAMSVCLSAAAAVLLSALLEEVGTAASALPIRLCTAIAVACVLLSPTTALISLAVDTIMEMNEYGKLLLPVMTGAMAARGGVTSSASLYAATALFNTVLSSLMTRLATPMLYLFLGLSIGDSTLSASILGKFRDLIQWGMTWVLKGALYLFTGYITVTGVITGTADAASVRVAKMAISSAVPVVGGILSDASEVVLISAGTLGSAAGVYGLVTVLALFAGPFVRVGLQYLLLQATAVFSKSLDGGGASDLIHSFAGAMGLLLAMISTQTILLLISTVCFMKGVT